MIELSLIVATIGVAISIYTGNNWYGFGGIALVIVVSVCCLMSDLIEHSKNNDS